MVFNGICDYVENYIFFDIHPYFLSLLPRLLLYLCSVSMKFTFANESVTTELVDWLAGQSVGWFSF